MSTHRASNVYSFLVTCTQAKMRTVRSNNYISVNFTAKQPSERLLAPAEFLTAASNLSLSTAIRPDNCLSHAKASSSLWHGFFSSHLQSLLDFAFFSFHLEDIFHYSHSQGGISSRLSCFLPDSSATLCLSTTSGPGPGDLPGFWGSMVFRHAPIPRKGSGNNNNNNVCLRG